ncbi:Putative efflux protein (fragment) [Bradyrhizobium sp. ORS 285]
MTPTSWTRGDTLLLVILAPIFVAGGAIVGAGIGMGWLEGAGWGAAGLGAMIIQALAELAVNRRRRRKRLF